MGKSTPMRYFNLPNYSFLVILFVLIGFKSQAQTDPMFTQYMHNPVSINPAYAGSRGTLNFVAMNRLQWIGIEGAPRTLALSVNSPFLNYNVGVGLTVLRDEIGPTKQTGIYADYAYHLKLNDEVKLSFGVKGGVNLYDVNLLNLRGAQNDNVVAYDGISRLTLPNFGIGTYLYADNYYVGFSIPKILQNKLTTYNTTTSANNREVRNIFIAGGMVFNLSESFRLKPSSTIRITNGASISTELTAAFQFKNRLWFGGMYRIGDAIGALLKLDVTNQLSIGYSYDLTQSQLRPYTLGTHEIFISYDMALRSKNILSPRYF